MEVSRGVELMENESWGRKVENFLIEGVMLTKRDSWVGVLEINPL